MDPKMKILIVEDQPRLGQFLKQGLTECRYTAVLTTNCAEAIDALAATAFDAVVLDLGLPDGDGLTCCANGARAASTNRC